MAQGRWWSWCDWVDDDAHVMHVIYATITLGCYMEYSRVKATSVSVRLRIFLFAFKIPNTRLNIFFCFFKENYYNLENNLQLRREKRDCELEIIWVWSWAQNAWVFIGEEGQVVNIPMWGSADLPISTMFQNFESWKGILQHIWTLF